MLSSPARRIRLLRWRKVDLVIDVFVEAELSLVKLYEGGALFDEVISFLDDRGFALVSLEGIDEEPATGQMLQVDAIFRRRHHGDSAL